VSSAAPAVRAGSPFRPLSDAARIARALTSGDRIGAAAVLFILFVCVVALLAPTIAPYDPVHTTSDTLAAPSLRHPFGTDQFGRDMLSRVIWGARIILLAPVVGIAISTVIGVPLGLLAGYSTRWISAVIMRTMDVILAFPGLLLVLIVVTIIGGGLANVMIAIGVSLMPVFARVVYVSTLAAKGQDYVLAARALGYSPLRIMAYHILPNVLTQIIVIASSAIGWAILTATTLNFLGFGVKLPTPDWSRPCRARTGSARVVDSDVSRARHHCDDPGVQLRRPGGRRVDPQVTGATRRPCRREGV
jgi:ABC-type dipeptide/oligopeptide/nickel transport system permease subunit